MNKYSPKLEELRARVLDTETLLHFMRDRDNLQTLLNHGCPQDTVGAMIDGAYNAISEAGGLSEALLEARDEDFREEYKETAIEAMNRAGAVKAGSATQQTAKESTPPALDLYKTATDDLEKIGSASAVISELMQRILTERTYQDCPDWMESNYTLGGLVQVSEILADCVLDVSTRIEQGAGHE
ncbi:hypothetical protein [Marinobacter alexandrii]|jgi:hypothetical protein|uniref:hypothetical protein n=1 Tax=Marinobacter alexandrii TaxID=2570351 RepID=UPI002ABE5344|nr:hypothetical protein [Marinobacter alexandrii]